MKLITGIFFCLISVFPFVLYADAVKTSYNYDLKKEKHYECIVKKLNRVDDTNCEQLFAEVKIRNKTYSVYLCPYWFKGDSINFNQSDKITVLGSPVGNSTGIPILLARMIDINGNKIWLRNYDGEPLWDINYNPGGRGGMRPPGGPGGGGMGRGMGGGGRGGMNGDMQQGGGGGF